MSKKKGIIRLVVLLAVIAYTQPSAALEVIVQEV